jgi:hypothetical protein
MRRDVAGVVESWGSVVRVEERVEASGFQVVQFKWLRFVATIKREGGEIDGAVVVYL